MKYRTLSVLFLICSIVTMAGCSILLSNRKTGFIKGTVSYPSESIPEDLTVCAVNTKSKQEHCIGNKDIKNLGFSIELPPGAYYVYARTKQMHDYKAFYTEFVTCGLRVECPSHKKIVMHLKGNHTIDGVKPHDWYDNPKK